MFTKNSNLIAFYLSCKVVHEEPDKIASPLVRMKRPFGGMINDIKRRYPKYLSDFKDALNMKCVAAIFFIYFACITCAITFGGLWGKHIEFFLSVLQIICL